MPFHINTEIIFLCQFWIALNMEVGVKFPEFIYYEETTFLSLLALIMRWGIHGRDPAVWVSYPVTLEMPCWTHYNPRRRLIFKDRVRTGCLFSIHKSNERLLYLALCWHSHKSTSVGHLVLAFDTWIVHWRCSVLFLCIQQVNGCETLISRHHTSVVGDTALMAWSD